jgi:hypothetical protein
MRLHSLVWIASFGIGVGRLAAQDATASAYNDQRSPGASAESEAAPTPPKARASGMPALQPGSLLALLPPAGTLAAVSGENSGAEAVQAVTLALRHKGYRVLSPQQVSARLTGHAPDACRDAATCDPELALATLGADAVVSIAVWQRSSAARQVVVHVRRVRGFGQAEVAVGEAGLRAATTEALLAALDDSQLTHEVAIRIESQPSGANVHVDQTLATRTPANLSLLPGNHLLSVEAAGYVTRAQYIEVPNQPSKAVLYRVQLTAADADAREAPAPSVEPQLAALALQPTTAVAAHADSAVSESSPWNYVVGVVLISVAVPLLANVVYTASTHGDCVGAIDAQNHCAERVTLGPMFYASLGVGSAALLGGVGVLVLQPIKNNPGSKPEGALLQWHRAF